MSYRLYQFGSVVLPTARISGTYGTGPTVDGTIRTIGGMYDGGAGNLLLPYETTYSAWIVDTATDAQTALRALQGLRGTRNILYRIDEDTTAQQWCWARVTQVRTPWQIQRKTMQPVDITFQVQTPWYGAVYGTGWSFDSGEYFDDGLFFEEDASYTLDTSPKSIVLTNGGNATTRLVSLKLTAGDDAITQLDVSVGDCDWTWTGTLAAGKTLIVNGRTMTITNDGADAYNGLTKNAGHVSGWWLELEPGANTVTVEVDYPGTGPLAEVEFDYAEGWE